MKNNYAKAKTHPLRQRTMAETTIRGTWMWTLPPVWSSDGRGEASPFAEEGALGTVLTGAPPLPREETPAAPWLTATSACPQSCLQWLDPPHQTPSFWCSNAHASFSFLDDLHQILSVTTRSAPPDPLLVHHSRLLAIPLNLLALLHEMGGQNNKLKRGELGDVRNEVIIWTWGRERVLKRKEGITQWSWRVAGKPSWGSGFGCWAVLRTRLKFVVI